MISEEICQEAIGTYIERWTNGFNFDDRTESRSYVPQYGSEAWGLKSIDFFTICIGGRVTKEAFVVKFRAYDRKVFR